MDEQTQFQDEYELRLADALDQVEQGYISSDRMAIIRHACGLPKAAAKNLLTLIYNFDELFGDKK